MFLSITDIFQQNKHLLIFNLIQSLLMKVWLIYINRIVSINLKNTILNYYRQIELPDISLDIDNLVIENDNELVGHLIISGYTFLESIEIKGNSLQNILSLTINNNLLLRSIIIENHACEYTMNTTLSCNNYIPEIIRSSSINHIYYRILFIQRNNFIEFDQFDWFDSTHLISLN